MRTRVPRRSFGGHKGKFQGYDMGTRSIIEVNFGSTTGTYMIHIETFQLPSGRHLYG